MRTIYHFSILLLLTLAACTNNPSSPAVESPPTPPTTTTTNLKYYHLVGSLGDTAITMHLLYEPATETDPVAVYRGYYYRDATQVPISLYGTVQDQLLTLEQEGLLDKESAFFSGRAPDSTGYSGQWENPASGARLAVSLRVSEDQGVGFRVHSLQDSLPLLAENPESPVAHFSASWLEAHGPDQALNDYVNGAIRQGLVGDSLAKVFTSTADAIAAYRDDYFDRYRLEAGTAISEGDMEPSDYFTLNYDETLNMSVLYNTNQLLTLAYSIYYYTGGAHGNYGSNLGSYQLPQRRRVALTDVVQGGEAADLSEPLGRAVRQRFQLAPGALLTDVLFEDEVGPTDNFGLTERGIIFNYPPYAIASYAVGEIMLFIPFREIGTQQLRPEYQ